MYIIKKYFCYFQEFRIIEIRNGPFKKQTLYLLAIEE
jgi:hypothetical protein